MADVYTLQRTVESLENQKQTIDGYIQKYEQQKAYIDQQIQTARQELEAIRTTADQAIAEAL